MADFDTSAESTYIYPINYPEREYQFDIVRAAILKNTLVCLPTGLGKTFIGAVLMYNFYRWYPTGKIVFMAPTRPLVAQQIEACYKIMGIPQEHTAEMTGQKSPEVRSSLWKSRRVFFLTPQVLMNDISRNACPLKIIKLLVVDEAHKALGNHSYCEVIKQLKQQNYSFRVLALSATPGSDLKSIKQVIANLLIAHIELRNEESPDILKYIHKRDIVKIVIPIEGELKYVMEKFYEILRPFVFKLIDKRLIFSKDEKNLTKYQLLLARDAFRQNPPLTMSNHERGTYEGLFAACTTLYHANELLTMHGITSFYNFLTESECRSTNYMLKSEFKKNQKLKELMAYIKDKFKIYSTEISQEIEKHNWSSSCPLPVSHPKMNKLCEVLLKHFKEFEGKNESTKVMIFSQYRDSVQEIARMLEHVDPLIKPICFIGQSTGQVKGLTQKEQLRVVKGFREGYYNTLISTCVGEEGLDIGEVDLIICYDAPKSPIRLVQRMGRTGRKREGKIIMLVSVGKEEKDYNQSQYQRQSLTNALTKGNKLSQFLYKDNPRMISEGINPKCLKLHMKVIDWKESIGKKTLKKKGKSSIGAYFNELEKSEYSKNGNFLNTLERNEYEEKFHIDDWSIIKKVSVPNFYAAGSKNICISKVFEKDEVNLNEYQPWNTTMQPCFLISHSKQAKHLVELTEFISVQDALGDNNCYEVEMAPFLNHSLFQGNKETDSCISSISKQKKSAKSTSKKIIKKGISSFLIVKEHRAGNHVVSQQPVLFNDGEVVNKINDSFELIDICDDEEIKNKKTDSFAQLDELCSNSDQIRLPIAVYLMDQKLQIMDNIFDFPKSEKPALCLSSYPIFKQQKSLIILKNCNIPNSEMTISLPACIQQIERFSKIIKVERQKEYKSSFSLFQHSVITSKDYPDKKVSLVGELSEECIEEASNLRNNNFQPNTQFVGTFIPKSSSILLTPPESNNKILLNSLGNFELSTESPVFSKKLNLPIESFTLHTSTPKSILQNAKKLFGVGVANVTPIVRVSEQDTLNKNKISDFEAKAIGNNFASEITPRIKPAMENVINFDLSLDDDLFNDIDLTTLVNNSNNVTLGTNSKLHDHNSSCPQNTKKIPENLKDYNKSKFKDKLSEFHRKKNLETNSQCNGNNLLPSNVAERRLLSVTQVIDLVSEPSVLKSSNAEQNSANMDIPMDFNSNKFLHNNMNSKSKIVKNLSSKFINSANSPFSHSGNFEHHNKTDRPIAKVKPFTDGWINCSNPSKMANCSLKRPLKSKFENNKSLKNDFNTDKVQFHIGLDFLDDSDDDDDGKERLSKTANEVSNQIMLDAQLSSDIKLVNKSNHEDTSKIGNNYIGLVVTKNVDTNNLIRGNERGEVSAEISEDELFDNLDDILAIENNFKKKDNLGIENTFNTKTEIGQLEKSVVSRPTLNLPNELCIMPEMGKTMNPKNSSNLSLTVTPDKLNKITYAKTLGSSVEDSPFIIKNKKKVNVLDSSMEDSLLDSTTRCKNKKSNFSSSSSKKETDTITEISEISRSLSEDDFVGEDTSLFRPQKIASLKNLNKKNRKKNVAGLIDIEAEEDVNNSVSNISSDESESDLDRYDQSFVDDETQETSKHIDMRAVYLQSVKSPPKKETFGRNHKWSKRDVLSQPLSGKSSSASEEDSFVVDNDFIEYDTEHMGDTMLAEDPILDQVIWASLKTANKEKKSLNLETNKKRKRIMVSNSSDEDESCTKKVRNDSLRLPICTENAPTLKGSNTIMMNLSLQENKILDKTAFSEKCPVTPVTNQDVIIQNRNSDKMTKTTNIEVPDFALLISDDDEDWLEVPSANIQKKTANSDISKNLEGNIKTDFIVPKIALPTSLDKSKSPNFSSKRLPQKSSEHTQSIQNKSPDIAHIQSDKTKLAIANQGVGTQQLHVSSWDLKSVKDAQVESSAFSSQDDYRVSSVGTPSSSQCSFTSSYQKLPIQKPSNMAGTLIEGELCIIVDTCEIGIAGLITSSLRITHDVQTYIVQITPASYIISSRMAVYRLSNAVFACSTNRGKLVARVRNLLNSYDRPVIIVEKDSKSGTKPLSRTSYIDSISCAFAQLPQLKVLYTDNPSDTANIIWRLMNLERLKGHCIPKFPVGDLHFEQAIKFYRTVPKVTCASAIFLALNFQTIREAVNSKLEVLMKKGKMSAEAASSFRAHFSRTFNKEMLPMAYQAKM